MCTFWSWEDAWDESANSGGGREPDGGESAADGSLGKKSNSSSGSRGFLWNLFVCKNFLLVVFGILGLITGSWISISELGASYMGIEEAVE